MSAQLIRHEQHSRSAIRFSLKLVFDGSNSIEMVSSVILILLLTCCVSQIYARNYLEKYRATHDIHRNVNYWKSSSNDRGQSHLLDLNDSNAAKSQQVFLWPFIQFIIRALPRGMLIIPGYVFQSNIPENVQILEFEVDPEEEQGEEQEQEQEPYQSIKRKYIQRRRKIRPPLRYQTI